ncbi:MAG: preprotein translocase subunit SecE [Eubacteriales bacterium]|jgi:preprotein translocase subunit SecE|nr:preprotein translocase subunit SecE [Eubacteriales bacterium]
MAQNLSTPSKDAKSAEKKSARFDAHGHAVKKPFWSMIAPKLLLPASILFVAGGLFLAVYNTLQIITPLESYALSTGLKVASGLLGLLMAIAGVLGLLSKKGKTLMTLGTLSLVYAIVILTATAKMGTIALLAGIVAIVITLFYILATDGRHDVGLFRFLREMLGEVKKLTWLSRKELFSHTLAVIVFVLAMALLIGVLDLVFSSGFGALSSINVG